MDGSWKRPPHADFFFSPDVKSVCAKYPFDGLPAELKE